MSLTLHLHPLSSFCHKVLIALYEKELPFERRIVDLADEAFDFLVRLLAKVLGGRGQLVEQRRELARGRDDVASAIRPFRRASALGSGLPVGGRSA